MSERIKNSENRGIVKKTIDGLKKELDRLGRFGLRKLTPDFYAQEVLWYIGSAARAEDEALLDDWLNELKKITDNTDEQLVKIIDSIINEGGYTLENYRQKAVELLIKRISSKEAREAAQVRVQETLTRQHAYARFNDQEVEQITSQRLSKEVEEIKQKISTQSVREKSIIAAVLSFMDVRLAFSDAVATVEKEITSGDQREEALVAISAREIKRKAFPRLKSGYSYWNRGVAYGVSDEVWQNIETQMTKVNAERAKTFWSELATGTILRSGVSYDDLKRILKNLNDPQRAKELLTLNAMRFATDVDAHQGALVELSKYAAELGNEEKDAMYAFAVRSYFGFRYDRVESMRGWDTIINATLLKINDQNKKNEVAFELAQSLVNFGNSVGVYNAGNKKELVGQARALVERLRDIITDEALKKEVEKILSERSKEKGIR